MQVGSLVRVKEDAFKGSDDPADFEIRGKVGEVVFDLEDSGWEIRIDDDCFILMDNEIDEIEQSETVEPDTPQMREIAGKIKALINQFGWDTSEKILVGALDLELVKDEDGQRVYERPDVQMKITFTSDPAPNKSL